MIPLCDLRIQYEALKDKIDAAVQAVCESGRYILGPNVRAFEQEMATYLGCKYAVGVGSGTDALHLALRALEIGPGDEVITTPFTFIATSEAICLVGAKPVFVDIHPRTFNMDPDLVEAAITPRTRAILPVHLYGQPSDMDRIMDIAERHGLHVVEDCAQALGASYRGRKVGTFGAAGCLSFFPSKNLGCFGDGGMVVTDDPNLYERVEYLRRHGGKVKYHHDELGLNSRLDELQAAVLRVKLPYLDHWNQLRRQHAYRYNALLADAPAVTCPAELGPDGLFVPRDAGHGVNGLLDAVYHQYTVQLDDRDSAATQLAESGIGCFPYYPVPLHLQRVHRDAGYERGVLPQAERAARSCLSLPLFPELSEDQQTQVAGRLKGLCRQGTANAAA